MPDADGSGPADGLPDLPPEWGRVVVPDDASALADEAEQIRLELRRGRRPGRADRRAGPGSRAPLALPALVLLVALLTTATALLAVTWTRPNRPTGRPSVLAAPPVDLVGRPLPALDLVDPAQSPVPLRGLLPAVILLTDACPCPELVAEAARTTPPGVTVVAVVDARTASATTAPGVRQLADPAGGLRALVQLAPTPGTVTALLVDRTGTLVRVVPAVTSIEDHRADLTRLTGP